MTTFTLNAPTHRPDALDAITIQEVYQIATQRSAYTHERGQRSQSYTVQCPSTEHPDKHPSCLLNSRNGSWKCFACSRKGGKLQLVIEAGHARTTQEAAEWLKSVGGRFMGMSFPEQPPLKPKHVRGPAERLGNERCVGVYPYRDENGRVRYEVRRKEGEPAVEGGRDKRFEMRVPKGENAWTYSMEGIDRLPYRLPEIMAANTAGKAIVVGEGEKIADALAFAGIEATCNCGGAGEAPDVKETRYSRKGWRRYFDKAAVRFVLADSDDEGRKAAAKWAELLEDGTGPVVVVDFYPDRNDGSDVLDWMQEHGIIGDIKTKRPRGIVRWERVFIMSKAEAKAAISEFLTAKYHAWADARAAQLDAKA